MIYGYSGTFPNDVPESAAVFYGQRGLKSFRGNPAPAGVISPASAAILTDSSITLSVHAVNTLAYQWQELLEGTWRDITGANRETLELYFPHEWEQEGAHTFRCACLGLAGTGYTEEVTITVSIRQPSVSVKSSKSQLTPTDSAKLTAKYQYADSIKWQKSTGSEWEDIEGATEDFLALYCEYGYPAGTQKYRAVVAGIGGNAVSEELTLTIFYPEPTISVSAESSTVLPPASIQLTAKHTHADHGIRWQELLEGEWEDIEGGTEDTCTVSFEYGTPRIYHYYRCIALGYGGSIASSTLTVSVTYYPPTCSITASSTDSAVTLSAAATYADIGLQWYELNQNTKTWEVIAGATETTYTVGLTAGLPAGTHTFMCVAAGYGGLTNSNTVSINISYQAPTATISSSRTTVSTFPQDILFGVQATHAHIGVQWQKSGDNKTWVDIPGETAATMNYYYTQSDKPKYIRCIAMGYGGTSASNFITITGV